MMPQSHFGSFAGPNRLWMYGPVSELSDGELALSSSSLTYTWTYRGAPHTGRMDFVGQPAALRCVWHDTFHAATAMTFHGRLEGARLVAYGTYPAGEGPDWGWRIELDCTDPDHLGLRMFNIMPDTEPVISVDLRGARTVVAADSTAEPTPPT
ncbi:MAG: hypothetical protein EXR76_14060 [Myxococcales bacterium]|nr:hypothetical protein [Myxococcales bacterium]